MKSFFLFLLIVCNCFFALSQNPGYTYQPFGYINKFNPGSYYTHSGEKVTGFIKFNYTGPYNNNPNYITFKSNSKDKKRMLTVNDIKAFVIGTDSFTILKSFSSIKGSHYEQDFLRVVTSGDLTLYAHNKVSYNKGPNQFNYSISGTNGYYCTYLIEKSEVLYLLNNKEFKDKALFFFGDDKGLMNQLNDGRLTFENIEQIVTEYNTWKASQ